MAVDKETIVDLSRKLIGGQEAIPRSKIRKLLAEFSELIVEKITIPQRLDAVVDEVMILLERLDQAMVSKSDLQDKVGGISKKYSLRIDAVLEMVESIYR